MQDTTQQPKKISELIKEVSDSYNLSDSIVVNELCASISEVLTEYLGYTVEALYKCGELFFIGRMYQHGKEVDRILSISRLKYSLFQKAYQLLLKRLDIQECRRVYLQYGVLANKFVYGSVYKIINNQAVIKLENIDLIGTCPLIEMRISTDANIINKRFAFYITKLFEENINQRLRFIFILSRNSKKLPELLLKHLSKDTNLVIKSIRRIPGGVSYLHSNKSVRRKILKQAEAELGEAIRIRPMKLAHE